MDFIDDFIQEYKKNPCLWKADSIHFKNKTKRQEAYIKLIDIAAKHGEHYNVERTKQKINNLRCAFRHQLKKYIEFKSKSDKDEPYCPKRRYFESLMFLKDEESPDRKHKRELSYTENIKYSIVEPENSSDKHDQHIYKDQTKSAAACSRVFNETNSAEILNPIVKPDSLKKSEQEYDEKSTDIADSSIQLPTAIGKDSIESHIYNFDKESHGCQKKENNYRKRSSSLSSQLSNETEVILTKALKPDFTTMDFEKLFSLAYKSIHSNLDDHFSNFGKIIAHKLRSMEPTQAIYSEKIIADVLFHGQMKLLSALSINQFLSVDCTNSYDEK